MLPKLSTTVDVFIALFDKSLTSQYFALAARLRNEGIGVELYPEPKKLGQQLKYADRKGMKIALVMGQDEVEKGVVTLKDLRTGSQQEVEFDNLVSAIRAL